MLAAGTQIPSGDVATWVGSIATAIALLLTFFLLLITVADRGAQRAEQRRAQARLVSAWCDGVQPTADNGPHSVTVTLQNFSEEPIYGVRAAVGAGWSGDRIYYVEPELSYVIPPRSRREHTISLQLDRLADGEYESTPPVEVIFNDASGGMLWRRDRYGGLTELTEVPLRSGENYFFQPPANLISSQRSTLVRVWLALTLGRLAARLGRRG